MSAKRITASGIAARKAAGERVACLTCYDYSMARVLDESGVDLILVGDSVGNVVQGYETTFPVTLDEMIYHTRAVARGSSHAHICLDLPFMTFQVSPEQAVLSAGRAIQEGGAQSVKIEGGRAAATTVARVIDAGIPVLGHIGYLPQSANVLRRKRLADTESVREALLADARSLEHAGCYAIVLEVVSRTLAAAVTAEVSIPTIGLGSGPHCDGQVLNLYDMLGLGLGKTLKHNKRYAELDEVIEAAVRSYADEVRQGLFPSEEQAFE